MKKPFEEMAVLTSKFPKVLITGDDLVVKIQKFSKSCKIKSVQCCNLESESSWKSL